ncbi:hypothetical protein LAZ40_18370 [Cereibacter sphaeroides]|uniref:hypothetical protein n=1 Tax=Rhodobacterales TaxID=204455 RepID=UPI000BBF0ADC|nr:MULTISPECIES: hypothetical protein [Paracoccaceae]MCE6952309.1 hypothetical protein [Cereibacter sphaeroides]MCE6960996.1 hypothetical protein [Cereibacter sphaeroides]MCE6969706.1 hypothetical protein [Cereibacter sphaeroides]MCE6975181.1 hypothetical protein [Cereibacter sphaeroides]
MTLPRFLLPALAASLVIAACGETRTQRAATGALGGAIAGEVIADDPVTGAVVGGVGGAVLP